MSVFRKDEQGATQTMIQEIIDLKQQIELDAVTSGLMREENDYLKSINAELLEALNSALSALETPDDLTDDETNHVINDCAEAIRKASR